MIFRDRRDAGRQLAAALRAYRGRAPVVLAIPRGGVVVGYEVARGLEAPLDIVVPRKLRAPHNPELAIGAVAHDGSVFLDAPLIASLGVGEDYIRAETAEQLDEIRRRMDAYRDGRSAPVLTDASAIVVDDGIATGSTMIAALRAVRGMAPAAVVAAIPVAPADTALRLRDEADDVICLHLPTVFYAVGQFYVDFGQTDDDEVVELLRQRERERAQSKAGDA
ncbi:MAG TPA: phosphoribosyltransferase family protein [bacterium]